MAIQHKLNIVLIIGLILACGSVSADNANAVSGLNNSDSLDSTNTMKNTDEMQPKNAINSTKETASVGVTPTNDNGNYVAPADTK